jgi:hypothetical protein
MNCDGLISVTLQEGITSIGSSAFSRCGSLTSITIPSTLAVIERCTFLFCTSLASVVIQNGINSIGEMAFNGCTGLISVNIPSSVISIGEYAFSECSGLTSIIIPSSVTSILTGAFMFCSGLTGSLTIPDQVALGDYVFVGCTKLTDFIVNPASLNYSADDGVLFNKSKTILIQYPGGKLGSYIIPNSVAKIGGAAFCLTDGLSTTLTIPGSVSTIGMAAFYKCTGLAAIYSNLITPVDLSSSDSVFAYINKTTCTLYVPIGSKTAYQAAFQWKDFNNIVEFITTEVELINSIETSVYPNPVTDYFTLKTKNGEFKNLRYQLFDINGTLLLSNKIVGNETSILMSKYISATYILNVIENNKIIKTFKIIKK